MHMTGVCGGKSCTKRTSQDLTSPSLRSNGTGTRGSDLRCTENKTEKNRTTLQFTYAQEYLFSKMQSSYPQSATIYIASGIQERSAITLWNG